MNKNKPPVLAMASTGGLFCPKNQMWVSVLKHLDCTFVTRYPPLFTLVGAFQGIFFSLVLLRLQGDNRTANRFLALFQWLFSVSMIGIVAYVSGLSNSFWPLNKSVQAELQLHLTVVPLLSPSSMPRAILLSADQSQNSFRPRCESRPVRKRELGRFSSHSATPLHGRMQQPAARCLQ